MFKFISVFILFLLQISTYASTQDLNSPDGSIFLKIIVNDHVAFSLFVDNNEVISNSHLDLKIGEKAGLSEELTDYNFEKTTVDEILHPVVPRKNSEIRNHYNELILSTKHYIARFRLYNDGFAYRIESMLDGEIIVEDERVEINFTKNSTIYFPEEKSFISHQERIFEKRILSDLSDSQFCSLPALVVHSDSCKILLAEADLEDYPALYYSGTGSSSLRGLHAKVVKEEGLKRDRDPIVLSRENYIAKTKGTRSLPWRAFVIAREDKELVESELIFKLAAPNRIEETSWIKPGKVAWDWWNYNNISGVDYKAGLNTDTYKNYIDFASENSIEYIILDEGWYKLGNLLDVNPDINIPELVKYGKSKNVGIILWVIWKTFDDQLYETLDQFHKWGIKGIKVDFMQRDDQWMVNYYYKVARECAKRKLLVNFHGAYTPRGLSRTYPNVITREGVKGLENYKWKSEMSPDHELMLPFTRMVTGPMDFTPGAMINAAKDNFNFVFKKPMSMGTRCHQLAMYVVYESPLQMLADSPTNYRKNQECTDFISLVPTVWDRTIVLDAKIGEYILIAREKDNVWYLGAMTNWSKRSIEVKVEFLPDGNHEMLSFQDGINSDRNAEDYKKQSMNIKNDDTIKINMAEGGGWAAIIKKKEAK
ncbi:MAG: glycoside hydrolase family 97 protein [Bacteroidetes bacterium]|nr:glycoside hydrolase family 97 protein [Bacteroidota bacterium]